MDPRLKQAYLNLRVVTVAPSVVVHAVAASDDFTNLLSTLSKNSSIVSPKQVTNLMSSPAPSLNLSPSQVRSVVVPSTSLTLTPFSPVIVSLVRSSVARMSRPSKRGKVAPDTTTKRRKKSAISVSAPLLTPSLYLPTPTIVVVVAREVSMSKAAQLPESLAEPYSLL